MAVTFATLQCGCERVKVGLCDCPNSFLRKASNTSSLIEVAQPVSMQSMDGGSVFPSHCSTWRPRQGNECPWGLSTSRCQQPATRIQQPAASSLFRVTPLCQFFVKQPVVNLLTLHRQSMIRHELGVLSPARVSYLRWLSQWTRWTTCNCRQSTN